MYNTCTSTYRNSSSERRTPLNTESAKCGRDYNLETASPFYSNVRFTSTPVDTGLRARFNQSLSNKSLGQDNLSPYHTNRLGDPQNVSLPRKPNVTFSMGNSGAYYGLRGSESVTPQQQQQKQAEQPPDHPCEGNETFRVPPKLNGTYDLMPPRRNMEDYPRPRGQSLGNESFWLWLRNYFVTFVLSPQQRELCQSVSRSIRAYTLARLFFTIVGFAISALVLVLHFACTCLYVVVGAFLSMLPRRSTLWKSSARIMFQMTRSNSSSLTRYTYILLKMPQLFCVALVGFMAELYHELRTGIVNGVTQVVNNF